MVLIIGHRGAGRGSRENSLTSFDRAIDLGADMVEIDIRRSRDGVLYCWHGVTMGFWPISWGHSGAIEVRRPWVPTWAAAAQHLGDRIRVLADLKVPGVATEVVGTAREHGMELTVIAKHPSCLADLPEGIPRAMGWSKDPPDDLDNYPIWAPRQDQWSPALSARANEAGKQVFVWTVNHPERIEELISAGVAGIITDRIDVVKKALERRGANGTLTKDG